MCEWLSSGDWCDVHLICGGQIFRSHRLVLASASEFLKDLLLSCPLEDSPTFIVLPEFDIDTLSLVLYYLYNGEVMVQRSQMKMFLEMINTMQIFVDSQYLLKISSLDQSHFDDDNFHQTKEFIQASKHIQFGIINKDVHFIDMLKNVKHLSVDEDFDKVKRGICSTLLKSRKNDVTDINFEFGNRQMQSHDAYVKTSLSGNNNGLASGVLSIFNEHYQEAKSLLSTNANAEVHRSMTLSKESQISSMSDYKGNTSFEVQAKKLDKTSYISNIVDNSGSQDLDQPELFMNDMKAIKQKCNDFRDKNIFHKKQMKAITSIGQSLTQVNTKLITNVQNNNTLPYSKITLNEQELKSKTKNTLTRVTILNQVLQSPWRPILPYNFRPVRRRNQEGEQPEIFSNTDAIGTQMRQHSPHYTCVECDKSFSQLRNFKYHMSVHRGTKEFATTCPVCGKYFNDRGYLSSHMKIHRNRKEYKCTVCPKSFNQRVAYNMHLRIHTGVKPHVCNDCGKAFSRKMLLKQHQRTHSGERPYACSYCEKRFADRSNMTLHLRLHTGIKPFICNLCPKAFTKKHHLKSHLNFHTGDKPYSCPRCKLTFTQSSNMRTHYKKCNAQATTEDLI
ncbi:zinc finger protein 615-like [Vanessa tameamea]|uniref:Zinc finger protein 615-like n=1 Tax=Vanessa tameamea TaxID=334116 RepID=A0A8B8HMJ2_VANTA